MTVYWRDNSNGKIYPSVYSSSTTPNIINVVEQTREAIPLSKITRKVADVILELFPFSMQAPMQRPRVPKPTVGRLPKPTVRTVNAGVLIGKKTYQMRRDAIRLIKARKDHPLKFLLDRNGNLKTSSGLKHSELINRPDVVEMGHIISKKSGEPERIMLQIAWDNRFNSLTAEAPRLGVYVENVAVEVGGIAVDLESAKVWEALGWLAKGTVSNAPRIR